MIKISNKYKDFIEIVVKLAHIKSKSYMWAVAKLSQNKNKTATLVIIIYNRNIIIDNHKLSLVIICWFLVLVWQIGGFYKKVSPDFALPVK